MKVITLTLLLVFGVFSDPECVQKLDNGFMFLKSYNISPGSTGYFETSYVCTKGTSYNFVTCGTTGYNKLEIYNSSRQKILEIKDASMLNKPIQYPCNATGIYYFRLYAGGGGFVLGFKRS